MASVVARLAKNSPKTFKLHYAPDYKTFTFQHIATDFQHPLHEAQKRRQIARRKEGLWWHVTTGADLNKSSCVRSWARRRLRQAMSDELRQRGYDETGRLVHLDTFKDCPDPKIMARLGKTLNLSGSLRLHVLPPLIPAKYTDVRAEVGYIIETLLQAVTNQPSRASERAPNRQAHSGRETFISRPKVRARS